MAAVLNPHGVPIPMMAPSLSPSPRSPRLHSVIVPTGFPVRDVAPSSPHPQRVPITIMSPTWQCPCPHPCGGPIPAVSPSSEFPSMRSYKHRSGTIPGPFPPQFSQCPQSLSVPIPVVSPLPFLLCALVAGKTLRSALAWLPRATRKGRDERGAEEACLPPRANTAGGTVWHQHGSRTWQGTLQPLSPHAAGSTQPHVLTSPRLQQPLSPCPPSLLPGSRALSGSQARASSGSPSSGSPSELSPPARPLSRWDCTMRCTAVGHRHQPPLRHREHWEALGSTGRGRGVRRAQVPQPTALHPPHMPSFPQFPHPDSSSLGAQPAPGAAPKSPLGRTWPLGTVPLSEGGV